MEYLLRPVAREMTDYVILSALAECQSAAEKQYNLDQASNRLGNFVMRVMEVEDEIHQTVALHGASVLATVPSLSTLARGKPHTHAVAEEISSEFGYVADYILQNHLPDNASHRLSGQLSETAVLGILWWGIANGYTHEKSWARPATDAEDRGTLGGLRNGVDIIYHDKAKAKKNTIKPIQVKSVYHPSDNGYDPSIRVVNAAAIAGSPRNIRLAHRKLFDGLSKGDCEEYWQRTIGVINRTRPKT